MLIWADFPSGQRGLYGTNLSNMLDGIWSAIDVSSTSSITLASDPDPNIGAAGVVLRASGGTTASSAIARFALPSPQATEGIGFRLYMPNLPEGAGISPVVSFRDVSNNVLFAFRVLTTGAIEIRTEDSNSGTQLGVTDGPELTAAAWNHIEIKGLADASAGTVEVRVNGITVLDLDTLNTGTGPIAQFGIGLRYSTSPPDGGKLCYFKDVYFWDTTGSEVNDFQGTISVRDLWEDADLSFNWTPSSGSTGWNLIDDVAPSNTLTASGTITTGDEVRIGDTYYEWTSGSVDTGSPAGTSGAPWLVAMGASTADAVENLYNAINATGVAGTDYSTALTAHTTVDAVGYSATQVDIEAQDSETFNITCTETGANTSWNASTLTKGPTDNQYISADDTPPAASIFALTDLPPDVTSVRGLIPIARMAKTDGGDANVQMSLSPDGTNWDTGSDRPITTAFTYYWDVSTLSPATSAAWTPAEVDDLQIRVDRTL